MPAAHIAALLIGQMPADGGHVSPVDQMRWATFRTSLRRWAEHFSRGVVLRRRLPHEFLSLPIYVSPEAGLRYWRRDLRTLDPLLYRMVRELVTPGCVVWDVGANVGLFSFSAAAMAGPSGFVLAIEPDLWLAGLLTRSADQVQKYARQAALVVTLPVAVSRTIGISQLQIAERSRATNHLVEVNGSSQVGGHRNRQQTVTFPLDFLLEYFPPPSVLKIDVETAEVEALRGASKLLRTARPVVWCEVAPENSAAVAELLHESGYQIYAAALDPAKRTALGQASWDTLAIPEPL
jgi:FkbM family methyltransferase